MKMLQLGGSRCHFLPLVLRAKLWGEGVSVERGEVGLPEKELGPPSNSAQTQGLPCKVSPPAPHPCGHSAWRPKKPCLQGAPHVIPLGRRQGCLGPGGRICVCVHENWHMSTCVAVSGCDSESERM